MTTLHPQLKKDCLLLGRFPLSLLLLMPDANYPWCILVPDRPGISEIYQLSEVDQQQLLRESSRLGETMMREFDGDKLNIGALGNLVPQLHVHHVVRFEEDVAWPGPVWGARPAKPYAPGDLEAVTRRLIGALADEDGFTPA